MTPRTFFHLCNRAVYGDSDDMVPLFVQTRKGYREEFEAGHFHGYLGGSDDKVDAVMSKVGRTFHVSLVKQERITPEADDGMTRLEQLRAVRDQIKEDFGEEATLLTHSDGDRILGVWPLTYEWVSEPPTDAEAVELRLCFG